MSVLGFELTGLNEFPAELVSNLQAQEPSHESVKQLKDSLVLIDYLIDELFELDKSYTRKNRHKIAKMNIIIKYLNCTFQF